MLENLIKERDALREEIENIRKQNEKTLLLIKGFYKKIEEFVQFCAANDVSAYEWHEFDGAHYNINCKKDGFEIRLHDSKNPSGLGRCFIAFNGRYVDFSVVGVNPSLMTITEKDGSLNEGAKWFERNIETIIALTEKSLEESIKKQIADAKKMLGR